MLLDIFFFVAGLVLILAGANFMTDGSSAIAKRLGMSDFVVGLTIVAMMTSAPELVVSVMSAFQASTDMAIGNIVGSNIFNILVIIGLVAMIKPIKVERGVLSNEIPLVILSFAALLVMGNAPLLDGGAMVLTRVDGIILLLFFLVFMRYTLASAKSAKEVTLEVAAPPTAEKEIRRPMGMVKAVIWVLGGLGGLILGGNWFVDGASGFAMRLGMSEAMVGLTIIAAGTSLPELATSVVAARKGMSGMCVGNVIGSCIFNIFFVLGITATIKPLAFGGIGNLDLLTMMIAGLLFWIFGWFFGDRVIKRAEGAVLFLLYIGYTVILILT